MTSWKETSVVLSRGGDG